MSGLYFDDIAVGDAYTAEPYSVSREEMLAFNAKWDPLPIHLDSTAAQAAGHKDITGSGQYTLCIKQYFINAMPFRAAVIGAIGFDELRFRGPVYAGDTIASTITCVDQRASRSKPDRGICKFEHVMTNQHGEPVLTFIDIVMLKRRPA